MRVAVDVAMRARMLGACAAAALFFAVASARADDHEPKPLLGGDYDNGLLIASLPLASRVFIAEGRPSAGGPIQTYRLRGSDVGLNRPMFVAYTTSIHYLRGPLYLGGEFAIGGASHDAPFPQTGPGVVADASGVSYIDAAGEVGAQLVHGPFYGRATVLVGWRRHEFSMDGCYCGSASLDTLFVQPRLHLAYALAGGDPKDGANDGSGTFLLGAFAGVDVYPPIGTVFGATLTFRYAGR
jgi:hypothetical protein